MHDVRARVKGGRGNNCGKHMEQKPCTDDEQHGDDDDDVENNNNNYNKIHHNNHHKKNKYIFLKLKK